MIENSEVWLLIIGAIISLVSTIVGFSIQLITQTLLNRKGKVKIFKKLVYSKLDGRAWGFYKYESDVRFSVPLWIEIHNTRNKTEVIRNLNLVLYSSNKKVDQMIQSSHIKNSDGIHYYANKGKYSFMIDPKSIASHELYFFVNKKDIDKDFDEVKLTYYDTNDKLREYSLLNISNPWFPMDNLIDNDWNLLGKDRYKTRSKV